MLKDAIYIDVETSGIGTFRPPTQRVVQLAWIINDKKRSYFINDVREVSKNVPHPYDCVFLKENGITFDTVIDHFYDDIKNARYLVAHNLNFDKGSIINEINTRLTLENRDRYKRIYDTFVSLQPIDTMLETVDICKIKNKYGRNKWPKLEELYQFCFNDKPDIMLHDALNDCIVTEKCLNMLIEKNILDINKK